MHTMVYQGDDQWAVWFRGPRGEDHNHGDQLLFSRVSIELAARIVNMLNGGPSTVPADVLARVAVGRA